MDEPLPLMGVADALSEDEYQAFILALSESARGRAFLAEHARRSRAEDSEMLLTSVQRLENLVRSYSEAPAETPHDELRGMLEAIRSVQAELDVSALAAQVAKLSALIEGVQHRLDTMTAPQPALPPADMPVAGDAAATPEPVTEAAADIAAAAEELFEPSAEASLPFSSGPFAAGLAAAVTDAALAAPAEAPEPNPAGEPATMPEVAWPDQAATPDTGASAAQPGLAISALVETLIKPADEEADAEPVKVLKAGSIPAPPPFAGEDFSGGPRACVMPPPVDPLADIKALSEDERLALFT